MGKQYFWTEHTFSKLEINKIIVNDLINKMLKLQLTKKNLLNILSKQDTWLNSLALNNFNQDGGIRSVTPL